MANVTYSSFWKTQDISATTVAGYSIISMLVLSLVFSANSACLLMGLDGTAWTLEFKNQAIARLPYSQLGVDALQGSFDAYTPAFREYFLPEILSKIFGSANAGKVMTYSVYAGLLAFSTFVLSLAIGFSRGVSLLAGMLLATLALPSDRHGVWVYAVYNLTPHLAQSVALCSLIIACFWAIDSKSWRTVQIFFGLLAVACVLLSIFSFVTVTALMVPTVLLYGGSSMLIHKGISRNALRFLTAAACALVPISLGMADYAHAIGSYTAYNFFGQEFAQTRTTLDFASIWYGSSQVGRAMIVLGLLGAVYAVLTGPRAVRVLGWTHIVTTLLFELAAFVVVSFFEGYHGPSPLYFEFMMWPFMLIFAALIITVAARRIVLAISLTFWPALTQPDRLWAQGGLVALIVSLTVWNMAAIASSGACQGFSPIRPTPITELLRREIALEPGAPFNGLVATFDGTTDKPSAGWLDLHEFDWKLWKATGNDLRTVGLWNYRIPTLFQYNTLMTPPYYLLLTDFLTRPGDRQARAIMVLTKPQEQVLRLWGTRYIITDFDPGFGERKLDQEGTDGKTIRLTELTEPNLGDYSPTDLRHVDNFRDGLRLMHNPDFDGRRTVITTSGVNGPLQRADRASLSYQKSGLAVRADSKGKSILVLPAQFSHCWTATGTGDPVLFRANLMQLGVAFEGNLDAKLVFRFGPVGAAQCRLQDASDMETLEIRAARTWSDGGRTSSE